MERNIHILLFDPDVQAASPLIKELESAGHQVKHLTAWEIKTELSVESHDAIVIAGLEPGNSSLQSLPEWVRKQSIDCPFILALAPDQPVNAVQLQSEGIQGYISRPYVPKQALKTIQEAALLHETEAKGRSLDRAALINLAADIFSVQDEHQLLDRIVHALVDTFEYKIVYFRLIEPDGSLATYACAGTRINYVDNERYRIPPGAGITGQVIRGKEPIAIRDLRNNSGFYFPDMMQREGMVAMLSVPLVSGDIVLGALSCYLGEPHDFSEKEIRFVSQWANLASTAINNTRLIKIQNQLSLFSRELAKASDLKSVLQIIAYHAQELVGADGAAVFPYDAEKQRFELNAMIARGIGDTPHLAREEQPRSDGISMTVLREGIKRVEDVAKEVGPNGLLKPATSEELIGQDVHAFVGIVLQASRPAGTLFLNYRRPGYLPPMEILKPLETLAYQAALAIERARENEHRNHERSLLTLASDVTASINSKDAVNKAWNKLLKATMALTRAKVGNISVITVDGRHLDQIAQEGFPVGYVPPSLEIGGRSIQGKVAQRKEPVVIGNVKEDPIWKDFYHEGVRETLSELTVPILERPTQGATDRHIIGIVNLEHDKANAFSEHDKKLVELICEHARIVIKIAQDWEKLTKRQDQLDAVFESAQTISAALDKETLFKTILEQAARLAHTRFATIQQKIDDHLQFEAVYPPELMEQLLSQIPKGQMPLSGNGLTVKAATTGKPVRVGNVDLHPEYVGLYVELDGKVTKAELAVPIVMDGKVWGVLNVESPKFVAFDDNDEKILIILAKFVATALKNIERLEELDVERKRRARIEIANEFAILTMHMVHRLKDLLTNISPEAARIQENLDAAPTDSVNNMEDVRRSFDQITLVSQEAIELLKIIRRPFIFKLERGVDPATVLNRALEKMRPLVSTIIRTPEWSQDRFVIASPALLEDVFKILLDNSQDAMPQGGVVTISIEDNQAEWLSITVRDNGPGIPPNILEEVRQFLPGYTTKDEQPNETRGGFGFGLYVANWFIRRLGGSFKVDSSTSGLDHGTTITFTLPKDTLGHWTDLLK